MLLAVYGTLRNGGRLHHYLEGASPISEDILLTDFRMYGLGGSHPYIVPSDDTCIVAEIYDVPSNVFHDIKSMEESAGYTDETVITGFGVLHIFVMRKEIHKRYLREGMSKLITSGDWLQHVAGRV